MIKRFRTWLQQRGSYKPLKLMPDNIPQHIAIIMDGNGRWANKRGLPRIAGHQSGMKAIKRVATAANDMNVKVVTMYAFSTENWKRPREEVEFLMKLPREFLITGLGELIEKNVQVRMMGYYDQLPDYTVQALEEAVEKTKHHTGLILNFALNYGSQREIVEGVRNIAHKVQASEINIDAIDENMIHNHLLSNSLPNPDLLIRTGGEMRVSNFMLWQIAYSELWFIDIYWPEFTEQHLMEAIIEYQRRTRRYGGLQ